MTRRATTQGVGISGYRCTGCGNQYRDIGRLFITVGGEESDNRGAEVGLWVEVILRVSLEVILRKLLRHLDSHPPGRGLSEGVVRGGRQGGSSDTGCTPVPCGLVA